MSRANMQQTNVISDSSINNLLDVKKLGEQLSQDNANKIALLKQAVIDINEGLKESYQNGSDVNDIVYGRSYLIDQLIDCIYNSYFKELDQEIAIVAVGGYGRGELHPKSDIDLMLLLKDEENDKTKDLIEKFLMMLWDIKLEIGHMILPM